MFDEMNNLLFKLGFFYFYPRDTRLFNVLISISSYTDQIVK